MAAVLSRERLDWFIEPILVLEMRRFRRHGFRPVTVMAALLLAVLPMLVLVWRWDGNIARMVLLVAAGGYLFLAIVMIPAYGSRSISREREAGTWDMLTMTLVKSSQIGDQKIVAAALPLLMLWAAGLPVAATLAFYSGESPLEFAALEVTLVLSALAISAWSIEASSECGSSAQLVAYLPALVYVCGCMALAVYVVTAVVLVLTPSMRAQAGRLVAGGICVLLACGASQYFVWALLCRAVEQMAGGLAFMGVPVLVLTVASFAFCVLSAVAIRCVVARSIERRRIT
jgi:ABC-type transport system involved in multi-copper enzyme maturation permease subunit